MKVYNTVMVRLSERLLPWVRAARPIAHPMIALPLLLGQLLAARRPGIVGLPALGLLALFGILLQAFILYLNDAADERTDRLNADYFLSGGSRVIPLELLSGKQLLRGAWLSLCLLLALGAVHAFLLGPADIGLAYLLSALLGWAYSMPPALASYRGWGELLQALSCGVVLPVLGYYAQAGALEALPWASLLPLSLLFYASNITTALPDLAADRQCKRRTYPTRRGESAARRDALVLLGAAMGLSLLTALNLEHALALGVVNLPLLLILWRLRRSDAYRLGNADTSDHCHAFVGALVKLQAALLCGWVAALASVV